MSNLVCIICGERHKDQAAAPPDAACVTSSRLYYTSSLGLLPVQLVVLFHRRDGVHRAKQYFGGDLNAPGRRGRSVSGAAAAAAGRRRSVSAAARAVQTLGRTVVVHVAAGTFWHPGLRRAFRYLSSGKQNDSFEKVSSYLNI